MYRLDKDNNGVLDYKELLEGIISYELDNRVPGY